MRVILCAVALATAVAYVGASPLLGAKVVHENASPFGTRFNFHTGTTNAEATSAEHVHNQQFRPKRNMQHQPHQHQMHLYRPVRQPMPGSFSMTPGMGGGQASLQTSQMAQPGPANKPGTLMGPGQGGQTMSRDGLFLQDVSVGAGFGGFGGIGPGFGLGFGGFGGFPGFGGFGGFGFPGFGGFGGFGFPGLPLPGFFG